MSETAFTIILIAILAFLLAATVLVGWTAKTILLGTSIYRSLRIAYSVVLATAVVVTYLTTYRYDYYSNSNTHHFGWPVSYIIFQRDSPASPWLDFVGPTALLAYPVNLIIYLSIPSAVLLWLAKRRSAKKISSET